MSRFLDSRFRELEPYVPGEQPAGGYIKLNTNEFPFPPAPGVRRALAALEEETPALYPDPEAGTLIRALAAHYGVASEEVFLGNGSDEVLAFAFMAFCGKDRGVAFPEVSYGFYPVYAALLGIDALRVPLRPDWSIDLEPYAGCGRTVFIANPNAPTGLALPSEAIERLLQSNPGCPVVADEAYVDFGASSSVPLTARYDNLLVVQTFSKSRGLAGARLGYAIGNRELIQDLNTMKFSFNPYSVNRFSMAAGLAALEEGEYYRDRCRQIQAIREETMEALSRLGFEGTPSAANFLFVRHPGVPGRRLYEKLRERGVLVRHFGGAKLQDYLRISVGTPEQMTALTAALEQILEEER
ncbi:MAG: histidinol-phosphate transaminase [Bacillota bacterium]|nr:histidinol-phosphate transaminase [Bacillota bacterium]